MTFLDFFINVFLEVQNERYSQILHLVDYIADGLQLWHKTPVAKENVPKTYLPKSCLNSNLCGTRFWKRVLWNGSYISKDNLFVVTLPYIHHIRASPPPLWEAAEGHLLHGGWLLWGMCDIKHCYEKKWKTIVWRIGDISKHRLSKRETRRLRGA